MFNICIFAERLGDLMIENGINSSQLADKIKTSKVTIGRYLKAERSPVIEILIKLADFFDVTIDFLIGIDDESTKAAFLKCTPFSERFKYLLEKTEVSKYRLEKQTHISDESIYAWLKGKNTPSIENVIRLAEFFDCSIDELLGRAEFSL